MGNGHYHPIDDLSEELREKLNNLCKEYSSAKEKGSEDAPRLLNCWHGNFEKAVNGATTVVALQKLQELACPNHRLARKLNNKLKAFEGVLAKRARSEHRNSIAQTASA